MKHTRYYMLAAVVVVAAGNICAAKIIARGPGGPLTEALVKAGVHIPQDSMVQPNNSIYAMTDGADYNWDIYFYGGYVQQGTSNAYSGGMQCQIQGSSFNGNNQLWHNAAGDEIELGPWNQGQVRVYRRVKVYKDQGLARWLEIVENTGASDANVELTLYTCTNWSVGRTLGSSGEEQFTDKDWAFATQPNTGGGGQNVPSLLHIVCDRKTKNRPTVQVQNNQIFVRHKLSLKPGQTAIVCSFEAQGASIEDHSKVFRSFQAYKALRDLSPECRKLIVNFPAGGAGIADLQLERSDQGDMVMQASGQPIFGKIANESFDVVSPLLGKLTVKGAEVTGVIAGKGDSGTYYVMLKDGQIVSGAMEDQKLQLEREGGTLTIPFNKLLQFSYKISEARPFDIPVAYPAVSLRSGDRLTFASPDFKLRLRSLHGMVDLNPKQLQSIRMDNPGTVHRAVFFNGSSLSGIIQEPKLTGKFKLVSRDVAIDRQLIYSIDFAAEPVGNTLLARGELHGQDEVLGDLADSKIVVATEFGTLEVKPDTIKTLSMVRGKDTGVVINTWDGSTIRGKLAQEAIRFEIMPGPVVDLAPGYCTTITRMQPLPPAETVRRAESLIVTLAAESAKDRKEAAEELIKLGPSILPLLNKNLNTRDGEVRQRVLDVIDAIEGKKKTAPAPEAFPMMDEG